METIHVGGSVFAVKEGQKSGAIDSTARSAPTITPANPIRAAMTSESLPCAGAGTPVCTAVAGRDEEGGSEGII
jgi:hypothetical protein